MVQILAGMLPPYRGDSRTAAPRTGGESIATVPIEWGVDMDSMSTKFSFLGRETKAKLKGRCKRCWGGLLGRRDENRGWTGIRCRVCGTKIEGQQAQDEFQRMQEQTMLNLMNMGFGRAPDLGRNSRSENLP